MLILGKLTKLLLIFLLAYCFKMNPAYATGNSLDSGTLILTPKGNVAIEDLHSGDRVIGYNFSTHQTELNTISEIKQDSSLSYYLINNQTKIAGTYFVYLNNYNNPKLVRVNQLKYFDKLIGQNHSFHKIKKVEQIVKPSKLYQLSLKNEEGNFFANDILVHGGTQIPTIFKEDYTYNIDCGVETYVYPKCWNINSKNFPGFLLSFVFLIIGTLASRFLINFYNFILFYGKTFTEDQKILEFTKKINPKFTNRYSTRYRNSRKVWKSIPIEERVDESEYQHLISKSELVGQVGNLFKQYHNDLANNRITEITKYFPNFKETENYQSYRQYLANKNNISYQPEINELGLIDFKQSVNKDLFRVQINGKMINFTISEAGYVLSGDSQLKMFSEYWDIQLDADRRFYLKEISLPFKIQVLQLDLEARLNTMADSGGRTSGI